jgi:hypothetical protein
MRFGLEMVVGISVVALAAATGAFFYLRARKRHDPEERRRALIDQQGRIIEGMVMDCGDGVIVYRWSWRGVDYEASQDVRALAHQMPASSEAWIGPVSVKFLPRDPSNSIVVSERWSGFRIHRS